MLPMASMCCLLFGEYLREIFECAYCGLDRAKQGSLLVGVGGMTPHKILNV